MKLRKPTRGSAASSPARSLLSRASAWHQASGRPASCSIATKRKQESGVASAGLTMTGHPAAIAGATWCTIRFSGWLKALSATTTPIGSRCVKAMRPAEAALTFIGTTSPLSLRRSSQQLRTPSMARATSMRESTSGLPPSRAARTARPSASRSMRLATPLRTSIRRSGGSHPLRSRKRLYATSRARSTASRPASGTEPTGAPSKGDRTASSISADRPAHSTAASWRSFSSSTSTRTFSE